MYLKSHRHHLANALVDIYIHIRCNSAFYFGTKHTAANVHSNVVRVDPLSYRHGESNDDTLAVVCIGHDAYGLPLGHGIIQQLLYGFKRLRLDVVGKDFAVFAVYSC